MDIHLLDSAVALRKMGPGSKFLTGVARLDPL